MSTADRREPANLSTLQRNALIAGASVLIVCILLGVFLRASFFRAYLIGFEFWLAISLGCMAVMMIRHLTGGAWGLYLRPILEAAALMTPLLAVLFLPLLIGLGWVYPWRADFVGGPELFQRMTNYPVKVWWFNLPLFVGRAAVYFLVWSAMAYFLNAGRRAPGAPPGEEPPRIFRVFSAPGLAVYGLTITFAAIDWSMSLNPLWFSTIYGAMYAVGQLLAGFAFAVLVATLLAKDPPQQLMRDLGNLLLAFTMLWAYLSFSQFLLIYTGNLPDETGYYRQRMEGGWEWVALALVVGQFALPFLLLLSKRVKVSRQLLASVAGLALFMRFVDLVWLTLPSLDGNGWELVVLAPAVALGIGGVWLSLFLWRLQRRPFVTAAALHLEVAKYE